MDAIFDLNPLVLYPLGFTAVVMYVIGFHRVSCEDRLAAD